MTKRIIYLGMITVWLGGAAIALPANSSNQETREERSIADWTIVCYIQADNNLAPFADYNIKDMEKVGSTDKVNMLVQWDQPHNKKTWRYRVEKGKRVDAGSLNKEMGIKPAKELIHMMKWAHRKYPAKHYMMILWNHGNGVSDLSKGTINRSLDGWLQPPAGSTLSVDLDSMLTEEQRGILYDDSEGTFLTNRALERVCKRIKKIIGKNIDVVGCDACLMAMIEVAHNMRNTIDHFVASQELEPGEGWSYSGFLAPLVENSSTFTGEDVANAVVRAYKEFYQSDPMCTQSAVRVNKLEDVCTTLDAVVEQCIAMHETDENEVMRVIQAARNSATEFDFQAYIDLHSFYEGLIEHSTKSEARLAQAKKPKTSREEEQRSKFRTQLTELKTTVGVAQKALLDSVSLSMVSTSYPYAKGISIYYPKSKRIDRTYRRISFARKTKWMSFLRMLGKENDNGSLFNF